METTIEGAQKRIAKIIDWYETYKWKGKWTAELEYIAVFLDSVEGELAAITSSCNSLHARYVEALREIERLKKANLNSVHAANDNH